MATSLMSWLPQAAIMPTATRPSAEYSALTNFPVMRLLFDKATDETCYFIGVLPQLYSAGNLTVAIYWTASTTGDCVWGSGFLGREDNDVLDASMATIVNATDSVTAADDLMVATITHSSPSLTIGDYFVLKIQRTGSDGSDTLDADARFLAVEVREA